MRSLILLCIASTAHADVAGFVEGGLVVGSDRGAAAHDHFELGPRVAIGIELPGIAGAFFAYRDMGQIDSETIPKGMMMEGGEDVYHLHAWDAGVRGYLPLPHVTGFAELSLAHTTVDFDATYLTLPTVSNDNWGVGVRIGALASLATSEHLDLSIGAAVGATRYLSSDIDTSFDWSITADAFVRVAIH